MVAMPKSKVASEKIATQEQFLFAESIHAPLTDLTRHLFDFESNQPVEGKIQLKAIINNVARNLIGLVRSAAKDGQLVDCPTLFVNKTPFAKWPISLDAVVARIEENLEFVLQDLSAIPRSDLSNWPRITRELNICRYAIKSLVESKPKTDELPTKIASDASELLVIVANDDIANDTPDGKGSDATGDVTIDSIDGHGNTATGEPTADTTDDHGNFATGEVSSKTRETGNDLAEKPPRVQQPTGIEQQIAAIGQRDADIEHNATDAEQPNVYVVQRNAEVIPVRTGMIETSVSEKPPQQEAPTINENDEVFVPGHVDPLSVNLSKDGEKILVWMHRKNLRPDNRRARQEIVDDLGFNNLKQTAFATLKRCGFISGNQKAGSYITDLGKQKAEILIKDDSERYKGICDNSEDTKSSS